MFCEAIERVARLGTWRTIIKPMANLDAMDQEIGRVMRASYQPSGVSV